MDRFKSLLEECKKLKACIRELENRPVEKHQETVREIQLRSLRKSLTEVGRQLTYLTLYKRDEND
jgi:hypothetical protein